MTAALCAWAAITVAAGFVLVAVEPRAFRPVLGTTCLILCAAASVALLFAL